MSASRGRLALLAALLLCSACGVFRTQGGTGRTVGDPNVLSQEQLRSGNYSNAFNAIHALRPNWLRARGVDSIRSPTTVQVYLDGSRLGGIDELRNVGIVTISSIRYIDGLTATSRWGLGHGQGVIFVVTAPR